MARTSYPEWKHLESELLYPVLETDQYIVFIDREGDIEWETKTDFQHNDGRKHNAVTNEVANLEATPCEGMSNSIRLQFKRLLCEALGCSLDGDYANANRQLAAARSFLTARSEEVSRRWYLSSSSAMTLPFLLIALIGWVCRASLYPILGEGAVFLLIAAAGGSAGALLSVIFRMGKLRMDGSSGRQLHYLEGASRIWAGAICGVTAGLAVQAEVLLGPLARGERMLPGMMLASVAAGASERWIPSIISKITASGHPKHSGSDDGGTKA